MATVEECERALGQFAAQLTDHNGDSPHAQFDRTLSCTLKDLGVTFAGRLRSGQLENIRQVSKADAQIRLSMSSDDLLAMVDGKLNLASAWATGRVKVGAGIRDMLRLRSMF